MGKIGGIKSIHLLPATADATIAFIKCGENKQKTRRRR
jgi:hypothetical protein